MLFRSLVIDGQIVARAFNQPIGACDPTAHAETNLVTAAIQTLTPDQRRRAVLYTSCEPCVMCAGAIYWAGIRSVVFALQRLDVLCTEAGDGAPAINPVARTNVVPAHRPPAEVSMLAFSYTVPAEGDSADSFVLAGGGGLRLTVECIDAELIDLSGPWAAIGTPDHEAAPLGDNNGA